MGRSFDVYNELGSGHHEKYYQRALSKSLRDNSLKTKEQVCFNLNYKSQIIGKSFLDFLVEDKIIVEIKKGDKYSRKHIDQVLNYLKVSGLKLAILINFGSKSVSFRRIINFNVCS